MHRRSWLKLGLAGATILALGGGAAVAVGGPGVIHGRLSSHVRPVMSAMAAAILDGSLPNEERARALALEGFLERIDGLVAGLPAHAQNELWQLLAVLGSGAGRQLLAGLDQDWSVCR